MKKQRLLSLLLAITTVLAMIPSMFVVATAERTETEVELTEKNSNGYYNIPANAASVKIDGVIYTVIDSEATLIEIAPSATGNYILADDMDFTDDPDSFKKIILGTSIFDGNGFAIYGYEMDKTKAVGTFGYSGTKITIRNLTLGQAGNPVIVGTEASPKSGNLGILAEYLKIPVTLDNVHIYGSIYSNGTSQIGGFTSDMAGGGSAKNCSFTGTIISAAENGANVGGIFANVNGKDFEMKNVTVDAMISTSSGVSAGAARGGIVGKKTSDITLTMTDCVFKGTINGKTRGYFGGLVGWHALGTLKMTDCESYAVINTNGGYVGGLVGYQSGGTLDVIGCENHGSLETTASLRVGGMIGHHEKGTSSLTNCINYGTISSGNTAAGFVSLMGAGTISISECLNVGVIKGTKGAAGIVTQINGGSVTTTKCANIGALESTTGTAGIVYTGTATQNNCVSYTGTSDGEIKNAIKSIRAMFPTMVFAANDDGTAIVVVGSDDTAAVAEAKFLQYKKTENGLDIRVIGVLNESDLTKYADAGFEFTFKKDGDVKHTQTEKTNTVYTSIIATEGKNIQTTYTAEDLCAEYLYAVELYNIPLKGTYTVEVKAFVTEIGATNPTYDNLVVITVVDGVIQ